MSKNLLSHNGDAMLNSGERTVADILAIVNYAIGKMRRPWNITDSEVPDLQQDGYLAAVKAHESYDSRRAKWSTWILRRVEGQLKISLARLRHLGMTGLDNRHTALYVVSEALSQGENDRDDEDITDSSEQLVAPDVATDEAADISSLVETVLGCVGERSKHVLCLYYGLSGKAPSLSISQLASQLGHSKKHAADLLWRAQDEARRCIGA